MIESKACITKRKKQIKKKDIHFQQNLCQHFMDIE